VSSSCGAEPVVVGTQTITPSSTTCPQFASGFETTMSTISYSVTGTKISSVTPTTFSYWVKVTSTGTYKITQSTTETSKKLLLSSGSAVYDNATASTCSTVAGSTITQSTTSDTVTVTFSSGTGPFYIGLNYSSTKVIGEAVPTPRTTVEYLFSATGVAGSTSEVDFKKV